MNTGRWIRVGEKMTYKYNDDDGEKTITNEEIIKFYYNHWKASMKAQDKEARISEENCIADFVIEHMAWESMENKNANNTGSN